MNKTEDREKMERVKGAYAGLDFMRKNFIQSVKDASSESLATGMAFGIWMNVNHPATCELLMVIENSMSSKDANTWLEDALHESGRFEKVNPRGYMTFKKE